jgi:hypothetical protein
MANCEESVDMNVTRGLLLFILSIGCAGCLELTQEVWVNEDGSGRMRLDIALPQGLMEMATEADGANPLAENMEEYEKLKADPGQIPNLRSVDQSEYVEGEFHHFVIEIEVDDVTALPETMAQLQKRTSLDEEQAEKADELASQHEMRLERIGHDRMVFVQTLVDDSGAADASAPDMEEMDAAGKAFLASMFAGKHFTVRLHAPKVTSTNGTVDEGARTTEWKIPLTELMAQEGLHELRAEIALDDS